MFGNFNSEQKNKRIEKVEYRLQPDSHYRSSNSNHEIIINTVMGRVYINDDSYFISVPESVWNAAFKDELSPKQFLEKKIGSMITDRDIKEFQQLLNDLIDAEFKAKNR